MDYDRFIDLYRQTAGPLRRYVARVLGNADAAEDIVQETFTRALNKVNFPREPDEARAYLFRAASNAMKDRRRRERRAFERAIEAPTGGASDDDLAMRIDVARLFAQLGLRDRQLIWLAHVEGADHAAIGQVLGVRESSVKVLLYRAREKLAGQLRAAGYGSEGGEDV